MARLILKSPYIKSTGGASGYLRYIATRERVELIPDDRPPTRKQEQLAAKLVKDFPDSKTLYEYEDYLTKPTTKMLWTYSCARIIALASLEYSISLKIFICPMVAKLRRYMRSEYGSHWVTFSLRDFTF